MQWPLAPNSRDSLITRANVSRRVTFFSKMAFGECRRVWRVRAKQVGKCWRVWRVLAKPRQMLAHDKVGHFKHKQHILYV
jgi:hypothetical protein